MKNVLVIGATGRVGTALVSELQRQGCGVRAASRRARQCASTPGAAPEVDFDFDRPETFDPALEGVDRVFLIARPGDDEADKAAAPLVDAMKRCRVRHVVNLTAMGVETMPDTALWRIERAIEDAGLGFTHLRPNFFMQIFAADPLRTAILMQGILAVPAGEARLSFVDARDVASAAAVALTQPGHQGEAYTLTGEQAVDHAEIAGSISRAIGRPVRYVALDEEAARRMIVASGLSAARAERLIGFYRLVRAGHCSPISADVRRLLDRAPLSLDRFARDYAHAWLADASSRIVEQ